MKYKYLFMDMDGTLFDFRKSEQNAFAQSLNAVDVTYTEHLFHTFHKINKRLWREYESAGMTRAEVQLTRYERLFKLFHLRADASAANEAYKTVLSGSTDLIDGALEICRTLSQTHTLYIITNGATNQRGRLSFAGLAPFFDDIFISEEIGFHKPQKEFFEYVLNQTGIENKRDCLVIGDSQSSDVRGARNAGLDSCLFSEKEITCGYTYRITSLYELCELV